MDALPVFVLLRNEYLRVIGDGFSTFFSIKKENFFMYFLIRKTNVIATDDEPLIISKSYQVFELDRIPIIESDPHLFKRLKFYSEKSKVNSHQAISVILAFSLLLEYLIVNEYDCPMFLAKPTKTSPLSFSNATLFKSLLVAILIITSVMPCSVC